MRIRRAAWWTAAVAAALVVAGAAVLLSFDGEAYRDRAVRAVSEATGRAVTVGGRLSLALLPRPRLIVEEAALANPPGFSRPEMARLGRLEAEARLWPLLRGRVEIARLVVSGADVLLERDAAGAGNWEFGDGDSGEGGSSELPGIGELLVRDTTVGWSSDGGARTLRIARLEAREREGAIVAEMEGEADGRPVKLAGSFAAGKEGLAVTARDLAAEFDGIAATGEFSLAMPSGRPRLEGSLVLPALDLDRVSPGGAAPADGRLIPDAPLDPAPLAALDLAVAFEIGRLTAAGLAIDDLTGQARLEDGRLTLDDVKGRLAGGQLTAQGEAQGKGRGVAAKVRLDLSQIESAELLPGSGLAGRFDAKADLAGEGANLRALVATLAGEARLLGRDGRIAGRMLDLAAADLIQTLAPWTEKGADTRISCMLFASTVRQGRAQVDALVVDADRVLVTGQGAIDLARERFDLQLTPRPKEASLFSLATPVNVRGPLRDPSIAPDEAGLARGAAAAVLGNLVLPGAGLLLPFLSAGAGDHPCAQTLSSQPAEARQAPAGGAEGGGVGGLLRGLGRGIDRALGTGR